MKLHHLDSSDVVFSIEDRSSARRLSMASKIELWTQTILSSLLVGVMDDPSLLTKAFKLGRSKQPPAPTISIDVLKQLAGLYRKRIPSATKKVDVEVTVTDSDGAEKTTTEKTTVAKTEDEYRAKLTGLVPTKSISSLIKDKIKAHKKACEQLRASTRLAFDAVLSYMTKETRDQCKSLEQSK